MTSPDQAENKVQALAESTLDQVVALARQSYVEGARAGIASAAGTVDALAANAAGNQFVVGLLTRLRDEIRLLAFQIPDPDIDGGDGEVSDGGGT